MEKRPPPKSSRGAQVCDRIQTAVEGFEWGAVAAGLQVCVSIGADQAREGDTVESLLHRSRVSMYSAKPVEQLQIELNL
jgi:hypothetical protein